MVLVLGSGLCTDHNPQLGSRVTEGSWEKSVTSHSVNNMLHVIPSEEHAALSQKPDTDDDKWEHLWGHAGMEK